MKERKGRCVSSSVSYHFLISLFSLSRVLSTLRAFEGDEFSLVKHSNEHHFSRRRNGVIESKEEEEEEEGDVRAESGLYDLEEYDYVDGDYEYTDYDVDRGDYDDYKEEDEDDEMQDDEEEESDAASADGDPTPIETIM